MIFFSSFLIILEPLLKKYFSAVCLYRLWIIILIGFLIPIRFDVTNSYLNFASPKISVEDSLNNLRNSLSDENNEEKFNDTIREQIPDTHNSMTSIIVLYLQNSYVFICLIWSVVALLLLMIKAIQYSKYVKQLKRFMSPYYVKELNEVYSQCIKELNYHYRRFNKIKVFLCPIIHSPMTIGIIKPIILLPNVTYKKNDLYFILKHEMIHIFRRDSLVKLVQIIVMSLNWYNPFSYIVSKRLDNWCEISCDKQVLNNSTRSDCLAYSNLLLTYTTTSQKSASLFNLYGGKNNMKNRLLSIMDKRKKHTGIILVLLLVCVIYTTVFVSADNSLDVSNAGNTEQVIENANEKGIDVAETVNKDFSSEELHQNTIVEYALSAEGTPYLWGGCDLRTGVDCSGLVVEIYKKLGYDLPRTSREQFHVCEKITLNDIQEGDLIFYASEDKKVNHVGIYIGDNKVIHAKNPKDGVVIQDINYREPYRAGRILVK